MYEEYDNDDENIDGPQHFQVNIVIHEGRHMSVRNATAKLRISIGNRTKTLRAKTTKTDAPYFNDLCIFQFYLPLNALLDKIINVEVFQLRKVGTSKLLGSFNVEMATVWVQPNHQFYHKWATLSDPRNPTAGVKGYIKCDIGILAQGSTSKQLSGDTGEKIENNLLVPFGEVNDRQRARFVFSVFRADNFSEDQGISALQQLYTYVKITYAGITGRTSIAKKTNTPTWNEELSFVDMIPALCRFVHIEMWDALQRNKGPLGSTSLDLRKLSHESETGFLPTYGPSFLNLYQIFGNPKNQNKCGFINNSYTYICRLLIALRTEVVDYAEDVFVKQKGTIVKPNSIPALEEEKYFRYREFILFAALFDVVLFDANFFESKIGIRVNIGSKKPGDAPRKDGKKKKKEKGVKEGKEVKREMKKVKKREKKAKKEEKAKGESGTVMEKEAKKDKKREKKEAKRDKKREKEEKKKKKKREREKKKEAKKERKERKEKKKKKKKKKKGSGMAVETEKRKEDKGIMTEGEKEEKPDSDKEKKVTFEDEDTTEEEEEEEEEEDKEGTLQEEQKPESKKRWRPVHSMVNWHRKWRPRWKPLKRLDHWKEEGKTETSESSDDRHGSPRNWKALRALDHWPSDWKPAQKRSRSIMSRGSSSRSSRSRGSWIRKPNRKVLEKWPADWKPARKRSRSILSRGSSGRSSRSRGSWMRKPNRKVLEKWPKGWRAMRRPGKSAMSKASSGSWRRSIKSWASFRSWPRGPKRKVLGKWPREWKKTPRKRAGYDKERPTKRHFWPWKRNDRRDDSEGTSTSGVDTTSSFEGEESSVQNEGRKWERSPEGSSDEDSESFSSASEEEDFRKRREEEDSESSKSSTTTTTSSSRSSTEQSETETESEESDGKGRGSAKEEAEKSSSGSSSSSEDERRKKRRGSSSSSSTSSRSRSSSSSRTPSKTSEDEAEKTEPEPDEEKKKKKKKKKKRNLFGNWKRKKKIASADSQESFASEEAASEEEVEKQKPEKQEQEKKGWYARWKGKNRKRPKKGRVFSPRNSTQENINVYFALYPTRMEKKVYAYAAATQGSGDKETGKKRKKKFGRKGKELVEGGAGDNERVGKKRKMKKEKKWKNTEQEAGSKKKEKEDKSKEESQGEGTESKQKKKRGWGRRKRKKDEEEGEESQEEDGQKKKGRRRKKRKKDKEGSEEEQQDSGIAKEEEDKTEVKDVAAGGSEGEIVDEKNRKHGRWSIFGGKKKQKVEPEEEDGEGEDVGEEEAKEDGEEEKEEEKRLSQSEDAPYEGPRIVLPEKELEEEPKKEPPHVRTYNGCNTISGQRVKVHDQYGFMAITGKYPCLHIAGEWPDALRRAYRSNIVKKYVKELEASVKEVEEELQSENPVEASDKMRKLLVELSNSCREILSLMPKMVAEDTNLSRERKRFYHKEIRDMGITTGMASQKKIVIAEDELKRVQGYLSTLKRYSTNPDDSFPDTEIWLTRDGKSIAQHRLRTQKIVYSRNEKERGHRSGIIESVVIRDKNGGVVAKLELFMWFGLGDDFRECRKLLPSGYDHDRHSCPGTDVSGIPLFLSYSEVHHFQLRVFLFQACIIDATDENGLSDPFVRVSLFGGMKETRVLKETLNPTWNEMIVFPKLTWYGPGKYIKEHSAKATVEVFDKDFLAKSELIGRTLLKPVVKLRGDRYSLPDFPPKLTWQKLWKDCNEQGKILLAAELLEVSDGDASEESKKGKTLPIPKDIRPTFVGHRLEVFFWGVRDLRKRKTGRVKVFATIECAGKLITSRMIRYGKSGVNFPGAVQTLDLDLPDESDYKPPLIIKLFQTNPLSFGRETYCGNCIVPSVKVFLCATFDDEQMKQKEMAYEEYFEEARRLKDVAARESALEKAALHRKTLSKRFKMNLKYILEVIAFAFVKMYRRIKCKMSGAACTRAAPTSLASPMDDALDWWVKYHAAKDGLGTNFDHIVIYDEELEAQPEFGGFSDNIRTFKIMTGKKKSKNRVTVGTIKAAIKLYRWPLAANVKTLYGVDIHRGLLADLPSNAAIKFVARIYVVSGRNLSPKDVNGKSDPYLILRLGHQELIDEKNYATKQINPVFGKCFEFRGTFPKENMLQIRVMDHDAATGNDLIGETFVDLESRYYTKHHASCGLAKRYTRTGYTAWRDVTKPTELLKLVCKQSNLEPPVYTSEGVKIGERAFQAEESVEKHKEENDALAALHRWHEIPLRGFHLVPEHIECRPLYHPTYPGIEQGKLEMWIDVFPADFRYIPPIVDITPRKPVAMELRAIVWNVEDVIMDDKTIFFNEKMSDIYVRGWLSALEGDKQQTDVHYRSMNGEGNFNWRFVFPFHYVLSERRLVMYKKEAFQTRAEEMKVPCRLELQVWDNDFFSDDFLGSLILELSSMPRGAKISTRCKLSMFEESTPRIDLFRVRRTRGWWPFRRIVDPEASEYALTGKIDLELEVLTEAEAVASPAGRGRDSPDALPPPRRPESSFLWFLNPWKTFRYIVLRKFRKYIIIIVVVCMVVAFVLLALYAFPGYSVKKLLRA